LTTAERISLLAAPAPYTVNGLKQITDASPTSCERIPNTQRWKAA